MTPNLRSAILAAIKADPYNELAHFAYADWLEEYGIPDDIEEANYHRAWTSARQKAEDWLHELAPLCQMTYEKLLEVTNSYLDTGESYMVGFEVTNVVELEDEFWNYFEAATGREVKSNKRSDFFTCCY